MKDQASSGDNARTGARRYPVGLPLYDRIRPARVTGVVARAVSPSSAWVSWTTTGDDSLAGQALGAIVYLTDVGTSAIVGGIKVTSGPPGTPDSLLLGFLGEGRQYRCEVAMMDEVRNQGAWSLPDTVLMPGAAPVAIADLRIAAAHDSTVRLRWTASGIDSGVRAVNSWVGLMGEPFWPWRTGQSRVQRYTPRWLFPAGLRSKSVVILLATSAGGSRRALPRLPALHAQLHRAGVVLRWLWLPKRSGVEKD